MRQKKKDAFEEEHRAEMILWNTADCFLHIPTFLSGLLPLGSEKSYKYKIFQTKSIHTDKETYIKKKTVFGTLRICTMALPCLCACAVFMDSARITIAQEVHEEAGQEEAGQEEEIQEEYQEEPATEPPKVSGLEETAEAQAQTQEIPVFITEITAPDLYIQACVVEK